MVRIAGTSEQKTIAEVSGIGTTVISRWFKGHNEPSAKLVVAFARAYKRPPVEALVAAGVIRDSDAADVIEVHRSADSLDDDELIAVIRQRMKGGIHAVETETPAGASGQAGQPQEVTSDGPKRAATGTRVTPLSNQKPRVNRNNGRREDA